MDKIVKNFLIVCFFSISVSQMWHNHPELNWETFETEHFVFYFHEGTERSANEAAKIAEKIYKPITDLYQFHPNSKTSIIVKDTDDIANGAAYYFDNKIEISALPLNFELRGSHRWLNNVITHEFAHIVSIGASMKYSRRFPFTFIQSISYEDEKRKDVLTGYPNSIISFPLPNVSMPPWFAEGVAQYMYSDANYDYWDSTRDMIIRDKVYYNSLFTISEMSTFGKMGTGNECVYNHGFYFVRFIVDKYGEETLKKICNNLKNKLSFSLNDAILKSTGQTLDQMYADWKEQISKQYKTKHNKIKEHIFEGEIIVNEGTTNIHPVWLNSDDKFLYLSNKDKDYFSQTDLYLYNFSDSTSKKIVSGVKTKPAVINDSVFVFCKRSKPNIYGSKFYDLYKYELENENETRLTFDARLSYPSFNESLNLIAAIGIHDGTSNIFVSDLDSINFVQKTDFNDGTFILSLDWKEDKLIFDKNNGHGRQFDCYDFKLNQKCANSDILDLYDKGNSFESRDIVFDKNEEGIIFSSDKENGIHNLFMKSKNKSNPKPLTCTWGGAFMPSVSKGNKILYSLYSDGSFNIAVLDLSENENITIPNEEKNNYKTDFIVLSENNYQLKKRYDQNKMSKLFFMPRIYFDNKIFKPGLYFYSSEVLNKISLFGTLAMNIRNGSLMRGKAEYDLVFLAEYSKNFITFFSNLYWIGRLNSIGEYSPIRNSDNLVVNNRFSDYDYYFDLFSSDIGIRFPLMNHRFKLFYSFNRYRETVAFSEYQEVEWNNEIDRKFIRGDVSFDYYQGHKISFEYFQNAIAPTYRMNMIPSSGYHFSSIISHEWNYFMDGFSVNEEYGTFGADLKPNHTFRIELDMLSHFRLDKTLNISKFIRKLVLSPKIKFGFINNTEVDDFFYFFSGGMPGLKGYTFYESELSGPIYQVFGSNLRFPIFMNKSIDLLNVFYIKDMTAGLIFQEGSVSNSISSIMEFDKIKFSGGLELRLAMISFYSYPTSLSYEYHLPLSESIDESAKHYFSILFDFIN